MRIKKGDNIKIIAGKEKGKTGKVKIAFPREEKVIVEGVNLRKRHQRAQKSGKKGQIVEVEHPLHISNVQLVDPKLNVPTRIGILSKDNGVKVRVAKKSGTELAS